MALHSAGRAAPSSVALPLLPAMLALFALAPGLARGAAPAPPGPSALPRPCPLPGAPQQPPGATQGCVPLTPPASHVPAGTGAGGSAGGPGGGASGGAGAGNGAGAGSGGPGASQPPPPAGEVPDGPYVVRQIETLGGERISGGVCRLGDAFVVNFVTPRVAFSAIFTPRGSPVAGGVSYQYSIPSAGESHAAQGSYTGQPDAAGRAVHISMAVSDHVVFHGFDGNIPNRYKFDLVSAPGAPCPPRR